MPRMPRSASPARHRRGCERARLYGCNDDHDGVLVDPQVAATLKDILARSFWLERVMGIEPTFTAWEAVVLPLDDTRARPRF